MSAYRRIPEAPREVTERGDFSDLAARIADWSAQPGEKLRMGAIWGERGSGKTSMIATVTKALEKRSAEDGDLSFVYEPFPFEPAKLQVPQDSLLFAMLEWLREGVLSKNGWPTDAEEEFEELMKLEAKLRNPERVLSYALETAVDNEELIRATAKFYEGISTPTKARRRFVEGLFHNRRHVVFVDDVDLSPSLGPAVLEHFHAYFPDVPLTVLVAADRSTLISAFDRHLEERDSAHPGLTSKILAKYLDTDWYLPTPTSGQRRAVVDEGKGPDEGSNGSGGDLAWLVGDRVWEGFQPPLYRKHAIDPGSFRNSRRRTEDDNGDEPDDGRPFETKHATMLASDVLPRTWRGVNRVYNRLAELFESLESDESSGEVDVPISEVFEPYAPLTGAQPHNTASFMRVLLALDESYPELSLYQSFVEDPDELRRSLRMQNDVAWFRDPRAEIPTLLRLEKLDSARKPRAERLLRRFAWLWQELWQQPAADHGTFIGLSVRGDALEIAEDWAKQFFAEEGGIVHVDLRSEAGATATGEPISIENARRVCNALRAQVLGSGRRVPHEGGVVVFSRAPVSVCAYLGSLLRDRSVAGVFGEDRASLYAVRGSATGPEREPSQPFSLESDGTVGAGEAIVVFAVSGASGVSAATRFHRADGSRVSVEGLVPFVYETNFDYSVQSDDDVVDLVSQAISLLSEVRKMGAQRIHLGLKMPAALAVLLGTRLNSVHPVRVYEWSRVDDEARYDWVCTVEGGRNVSAAE